ncbi:arsenate reductase/protein-tyrosine-phosphatase family protein [Methanobrevibacter curvatus]|uniref:Low molecular weight protein-tyrosine-phosphatase YwlE n=1 Tax=Methanobrevibacter curvatus TaxID=49547 RepID=A0A166A3K6_9EURY|nr:low molecular weight phosphatase family protein [Methanobrevibacter curvatus]KZX11521.1 Low molecular weight protein-tyrosine-phosphatase YwlE [Methanobrevibacter curvatus]
MVKRVLFICTANICRSAMAEGLFNEKTEDNFHSFSSGIYAYNGNPTTKEAIKVLKEKGIDISSHRSQELTIGMLNLVDYVFVMTDHHLHYLVAHFPENKEKYFKLAEEDIDDPYMKGYDAYKESAEEISQKLDEIIERLFTTN